MRSAIQAEVACLYCMVSAASADIASVAEEIFRQLNWVNMSRASDLRLAFDTADVQNGFFTSTWDGQHHSLSTWPSLATSELRGPKALRLLPRCMVYLKVAF